MAYKKFDDPTTKTPGGSRDIYDAVQSEALRRALQGITNRVLGSNAGTAGSLSHITTAALTDGGTAGVKIVNPLKVLINGAQDAVIAQDNLLMPKGTQAALTIAKYLVSTGNGTSGTVSGPGNVVLKADYASDTLAAAACKLPDPPDGHCVLGYLTLTTGAVAVVQNAAAFGTTQGTSAYTNLMCMPYDA